MDEQKVTKEEVIELVNEIRDNTPNPVKPLDHYQLDITLCALRKQVIEALSYFRILDNNHNSVDYDIQTLRVSLTLALDYINDLIMSNLREWEGLKEYKFPHYTDYQR